MKFNRKFVVALSAAMLMSAVPVTTYGEVIVYSPGKSSTSSKTEKETKDISLEELINSGKLTIDQIAKMGPGYASAIVEQLGEGLEEVIEEENKDFNGPSVKEVDLRENYHDLYKTYELSLADMFFMYTNVGNGGMTHEPVMIDIPANISYSMEKDGLPYEYISKTYISEKGTYVMKLTGVENKELPLSEQVEYKSTFRFRITDEPPVEETEAETAPVSTSGSMWGESVEPTKEIPLIAPPETKPAVEAETVSETESETNAEKEPETEVIPESEAIAEPDVKTESVRTQEYEHSTGNYVITLENGRKLTSSVPEGYVGPNPVYVSVSDGDAVITKLYKNEELQEFVNNSSFIDHGHYRIEMDGYSYHFTLAHEVGQMDYYPVPAGMEFTEVRYNDELLDLSSNQYVEMREDGTYQFMMTGSHGERLETTLVKDTVAPEISVSASKSTASIQYLSQDIDQIVLIKDGNEVSGFSGTSINEPGKYTLTVYDGAGNAASASFNLKYQMNFYGILAIVLVILSIAGIGGFIVYTKKNTKVR